MSNEKLLRDKLIRSQQKYRLELILSLFDFAPVLLTAKYWHRDILEIESSFNEGTIPFIRNIISMLSDIEDVGSKFQNQLRAIASKVPMNEDFLNKRIEAASQFFDERLNNVIESFYESTATTDSRANAKVYDDRLNEVFCIVSQKRHIIEGIKENPDIERYFELRKNFKLPRFTITSHSRATSGKKLKSDHPELLSQLIQLRNRLADENDIAVYVVANTDSLIEMSNLMPHNKEAMLNISGIGTKRYERFGEQFLELTNSYREMNGIEINENIESPKKKKKKPKKAKGSSARESLRMYNQGMTIGEIARERLLAESTIAGHLSSFVKTGEVNIYEFVTKEQIEKAEDIISKKSENVSYYSAIKDSFSRAELGFLVAYLRKDED